MAKEMKKAFFIVGRAGPKGKKFFVRKPFSTRERAEKEIMDARKRAKKTVRRIRKSGRLPIPSRIKARVIRRPRFGFRRR